MSADYVKRATVEVATDASMAHALDHVDGEARQKVIDLIKPALADYPPVIDAAAEAASDAVDAELAARKVVQSAGSGSGGLQQRFPETGQLGWHSDTARVDPNLGTTLPDVPTIAALQRVGFPTVANGTETTGVGFGIRASDGRNTALELADQYDETTGTVPLSLRAAIAVGIVRAPHHVTGAQLAALVPLGRYVLHEQSDGYHLILGEKTNA